MTKAINLGEMIIERTSPQYPKLGVKLVFAKFHDLSFENKKLLEGRQRLYVYIYKVIEGISYISCI